MGMNVPEYIDNPVKFETSGYYVLSLTEFQFETTLIGFDIYSLSPIIYTLFTYVSLINFG